MNRSLTIWLLSLMALAGSAAAQTLDLTRSRIPGGGSVSTGGQFGLFSTVGQPEAAPRSAGGAFALDTGFLSAMIPSPVPTVFFPQGTVTVLEDAGSQTRTTYAVFEPGQAGEPAQPPTYQLSDNNPALFSVAPAIATNRALTFTPATNANGTALVTVVVRADGANVVTNTFAIVVTAVNDAPSVTLTGNMTVLEDVGAQSLSSFATFTAGPADESAQTPTYTLTADNTALFSVQPAIAVNGTLTFTPATNANGLVTVTVVTVDGGGTANSGGDRTTNTFTLTVTAVNDQPSAVHAANNVAVLEDAGAQTVSAFTTFTAGPTDESTQTPAYTLTADNAALFSVQPAIAANGTLTFTPAANANGAATVTVVVADSGGTAGGGVDSNTNSFTITVTAVNDAASAAYATNNVVVLEDAGAQSVSGFATFTAGPADESAQTPSYTLTADNAALFSVQPALAANGTLTFTPATNANGSAIVTVITADNGGTANNGADRSTNSFSITVTAVNDQPSVSYAMSTVTVLEDAGAQTVSSFATFTAGPADESAQTATYTLTVDNAALFSSQPALAPNGTLTFTPAANANGSATITVVLQDSGGTDGGGVDKATNTFSIAVTAVNDAPSVAFATNNVIAVKDTGAQTATGFAAFTAGPPDESAQTPAYTLSSDNAALFSALPAIAPNGTLTFTPAAGTEGMATVTVVVQDSGGTANGGSDKATNNFTITVVPFSTAPDSYAVSEDRLLTIAASAGVLTNDVGVGLGVRLVDAATNGTVTLNANGSFTYLPATNFHGTDTFTYQATNSLVASAPTAVTITVSSVNDAPSVAYSTNDVVVLEDAGARSFAAFAAFTAGPTNESAQTLVGYTVSNSSNALFSVQPAIDGTGQLTFTPATNANGSATVTVVVQDSGGADDSGVDKRTNTFVITVIPVNDAPSFTIPAGTSTGIGSLWAWGGNELGGVGDSTTVDKIWPVLIGANAQWRLVSAGANATHSVAVKADGTLWAWGGNSSGQLGDGTFLRKTSPVQIGTDTDWRLAGAGENHTVALKNNGTLWAWGWNGNGWLGDGTTSQRKRPLQIGTDTDWRSVAAGAGYVILLKTDGSLWAWGVNGHGQLGDGTTTLRLTPVQIGTDNNWLAMSAGQQHTVAVRADGTLWAWGWNFYGQLGDSTDTSRLSPVQIETATNWQSVSAGALHTAALKTDGTLWAWGYNDNGQLGDGTTTRRRRPVQIGTDTDWRSVSAGYIHTMALKTDGALWGCGLNAYGQLGDGTTIDRHTPVKVSSSNRWQSVAAGSFHTVALGPDVLQSSEDSGSYSGTAFATGISPGPANESGQAVHFLVSNDSNTLFSIQPTVAPDGTLTFTPAANANGTATMTIVAQDDGGTANGGMDKSTNTFAIVVTPVNDTPSVTFAQSSVMVLEDAGAQTVAGFATFSAGPANEAAQALVGYTVSSSSNALFSVQPAIDNDGRLTFTPATNANGSATVTVVVQDNSAVADGGVDKSTNTFTLTVTPVNDAPSVTFAQSVVTVLEDAGAQAVNGFATFSPGPANESAQTLVGYTVTMNNAALFATGPVINNAGMLTFTPATNANGSATVTVVVQDNGGTTDGGVDRSTNTFTVMVTAVNDTPVANNDNYTMSQGDALTVAAAGVLANDTDVENNPLTATKLTSPTHGTITFNADGGLTYTPDTSFYGVDSFTYRASDASSNSAPATVNLTVLARPVVTPPPGKQRVFSSAALRFSATNAPDINAIRVADPDSPALMLTLTVTNGTLAVTVTNGLAFPNGSTNTNTLVLAGPITDLNAALESLAYVSVTNYFGDDTLVLVAQDEGGRTNRGNGVFDIQVEIPARGASLEVPLNGFNNPGLGRMVTNATAVTLDTNLVEGITYDPTNNVVNVLPVGGQDGSTNRSTITFVAHFNDGTTQLITVPVIIYQPLLTATTNLGTYNGTFGAPLFNPQTSLYEQKVSVQNNTPFDFTALRVTATNLPATVTLQNATVTNGGRAYIDYNLAVASGSNVTLKLEYFSSNLLPFTPGLKLELLNQSRTNAAPTNAVMSAVAPRRGYAPDGLVKNYLQFPSRAGQVYYVQYQDVAGPVWKTSPVVITGTGFIVHWMDDGPPNTDTPPGPARFYRVVTDR